MEKAELDKIIADHGLWLNDPKTGKRADLSGADLSGANLYRANLFGANLYRANLSDANLSGANLSRADLSRANLSRAYLFGAYLSGADLSRANLYRADLSGAGLYGANLSGANLSRADLSGASIVDAGQDSRGYRFVANVHDDITRISAGCRWFTVPEARQHWAERHQNNPELHTECLAKVELIGAVAKARGWPV